MDKILLSKCYLYFENKNNTIFYLVDTFRRIILFRYYNTCSLNVF